MYPKDFFFDITKAGIDGRRSLLNAPGHSRRRSSVGASIKDSRRKANARNSVTAPAEDAAHEDEMEVCEASDEGEGPLEGQNPEAPKKDAAVDAAVVVDSAAASEPPPDTVMDDLAGAMSSLRFVPQSVRFGRGKGRVGFSRS